MISRLTLFSNGVDRIAKNGEFRKNSNSNTSQIKKTIKDLIENLTVLITVATVSKTYL